MPPLKPNRKFSCTIGQLYATCRLCWSSCLSNIDAFSAFKTTYTTAFVHAMLAEIDAAEALPNEDRRALEHESLRKNLVAQGEICLSSWRSLRAYIKGSFEEAYYKMNLDAAGGNYYEEAVHERWEVMQLMLSSGKEYLGNNIARLEAHGMPASFPAYYEAQAALFTPLYNSFKDAQMDAAAGTIVRLNANNALYEKTIAMNFDGQTIFAKDPERYNRFVFARVLEMVSSGGGTPSTTLVLHGVVKNGGTVQPISHIQVTLTLPGAPVQILLTDERGKYEFRQTGMMPGTIAGQLKVEVPGFEIFQKNVSLTIGNSYAENVTLVPIVELIPNN